MSETPTGPAPAASRTRPLIAVAVIAISLALLVAGAFAASRLLPPDPVGNLPAWDQLDTRWGT